MADETRRMPVKTADIAITLAGYEGWRFTVRSNPKQRTMDDLFSMDTARMREALNTLIVDWNYVDEAGAPLPLPQADGLGECTDELIDATWSAFVDWLKEKTQAPKASGAPSAST